MNSFPQLPGEPADAFEQLLLHRDFGPSRQFSQTADVVGRSESTLRGALEDTAPKSDRHGEAFAVT